MSNWGASSRTPKLVVTFGDEIGFEMALFGFELGLVF
jgi:hypothetical protein